MAKRHHLWAVAGLLVGRYGNNAGKRADAYARQAEREGDDDSRAIWSDVAGVLHRVPHDVGFPAQERAD